jgi:hypothetical protein
MADRKLKVTLLLTNGDRVDVNMFGAAMQDTGLVQYAYTPPHKLAISEWPTLQELVRLFPQNMVGKVQSSEAISISVTVSD